MPHLCYGLTAKVVRDDRNDVEGRDFHQSSSNLICDNSVAGCCDTKTSANMEDINR